ncbi:phage adaptor protein [Phenylobacterium sp.]|uniref:phage adaptor protein n=1 Tax=Phenylobacterium sp. TaxID=1871053 RepID=UPI002FCBC06D
MAISTFSELKTAAANWLERSDLTDRIPEFIALGEAVINAQLKMRTAESDAALTGVVNSRLIALPAGYRQPRALWIVRSSGAREALRPTLPELHLADTASGEPRSWCVDGTNIAFERPCDQAYSFVLRMVGGLALSDASPTNLILTNYPNLYLFAALKEAGPFLRDNDLISMFEAKFESALQDAITMEGRARKLTTLSTELAGMSRHGSGYNVVTDQ